MVDAEPRKFVVAEQDAMVSLAQVEMHRAFEADKSGKTSIHLWMQANVTLAAEDFESIEADVEFVLYNEDRRLGSCASRNLKFTDKEDKVDLVADDELRIDPQEDVTHIEVHVEAAMVTRSKTQMRIEPEPL